MRGLFRREPAAAITTGVNELIQRVTSGEVDRRSFWKAHGREKLRLWLSVSDQYQTPESSDAQALMRFQHEVTTTLAALEALPPGREDTANPDCVRSLVFSNVITYSGERGFRSMTEMWNAYVQVLENRGLSPKPVANSTSVSAPKPGRTEPASAGTLPRAGSELDIVRLASFTKLLLHDQGEAVPGDLRAMAPVYRDPEDLARHPEEWAGLPADRLWLLASARILHHAYTNDPEDVPRLGDLYGLATRRLPIQDRLRLVKAVADVLDSDVKQLNALMPFMFHDPDLAVVSTASLSYATVMPLQDGNPLSGPMMCWSIVENHTDNDEPMAAGILAGILALGDWRILPLLDGVWHRFSLEGQRLLSRAWFNRIYASTIELWLRWLEDVEEHDFGFPAAALVRLPRDLPDLEVEDLRRRFPAPYNLSEADYAANPPVTLVQKWSIAEYARIIEPRLRLLLLRETYDKVMPRMLEEWGLEVGEETEEDQYRRIFVGFDVVAEALRRLADDVPQESGGKTADERARRFIASTFSDAFAPQALALATSTAEGFERIASEARRQADSEDNPDERAHLLTKAEILVDEAHAIVRHLRQYLGPDLQAALHTMLRALMKVRPDVVVALGLPLPDTRQD